MRNDVRVLRLERKLSQGALAEALGVSRQTINSIEADRYTPSSLPLAIAHGRSGNPWAPLGALGGVSYLAALLWLRWRG
jgi:putative transcriptional regulator